LFKKKHFKNLSNQSKTNKEAIGQQDYNERTIRVFLTGHEGEDGLSIIICLLFTRSSWILAVIGQFIDTTQVTNCITMSEENYNRLNCWLVDTKKHNFKHMKCKVKNIYQGDPN